MASQAMKITLERIALFQFTPAHCAQARAMLGWSVEELSREAGVSVEAIQRFEARREVLDSSSKKDLKQMPSDVQDVFGHALDLAQSGKKHPDAKPLKGFGGAGVLELIEDFDTNTYRAVYTVNFGSAIYVLHRFQKKSTTGIKTAQCDIDLIRKRLQAAQDHAKGFKNG